MFMFQFMNRLTKKLHFMGNLYGIVVKFKYHGHSVNFKVII